MGFLDKVKEQGTALAAKAQEGVKQGQSKLDEQQARKHSDALLRDLGAWLWAQHNSRDGGQGDAEVSRLLGELAAHEADHGALPLPGVAPAPSPSAEAPPPPPPGAGAAEAPEPPAASAAPAPPAPAPAPPAAAPAPPPGGFTLEDL